VNKTLYIIDNDVVGFLKLGGITMIVAATGCLDSVSGYDGSGSTTTDTPNAAEDSPGLAFSKSGPGQLAESDEVHSGWVHVVAHGETYDLTFDVRICHGRGSIATAELDSSTAGEYVLGFSTMSATETNSASTDSTPGSDCDFGTRMVGSGRLPGDVETLEVRNTYGIIQPVVIEGTTPIMRPLSDPVES
jgi:hypothetical protein